MGRQGISKADDPWRKCRADGVPCSLKISHVSFSALFGDLVSNVRLISHFCGSSFAIVFMVDFDTETMEPFVLCTVLAMLVQQRCTFLFPSLLEFFHLEFGNECPF